jgi:hypothetical protein
LQPLQMPHRQQRFELAPASRHVSSHSPPLSYTMRVKQVAAGHALKLWQLHAPPLLLRACQFAPLTQSELHFQHSQSSSCQYSSSSKYTCKRSCNHHCTMFTWGTVIRCCSSTA